MSTVMVINENKICVDSSTCVDCTHALIDKYIATSNKFWYVS